MSEGPNASDGTTDATGELSWPLVDRRRRRGVPPEGNDRRRTEARLDDLAEANDLLHALQRLSLTLPATLDLDRLLDDADRQIRDLLSPDRIFVLLRPRHVDPLPLAVARTTPDPDPDVHYQFLHGGRGELVVPAEIRSVLSINRSRRLTLAPGHGLHSDSTVGVYSALRARGTLIGLLGVEWTRSTGPDDPIDDRGTELLTGIADALGLGLDNALLFRTLRISGADDERRRLAREVHDRTGSSLAAIGFELDHLARRLRDGIPVDDAHRTVRDTRARLDDVIADVREFLFDLRAEPGPESGIERFIGDYVEHVGRRAGIDARSEIADLPDLPAELTRQVWNIVREAILNAERHARARTLRVSVAVENDALEVRVVDDGRGFEPDAERMGSFGIAGMRERAALLGAGLAIESSAKGTTVRLTVPWPEKSDGRR